MLETFVQASYFERIIRRANVRLMIMSSGQYELKRAADASNQEAKAGLSLMSLTTLTLLNKALLVFSPEKLLQEIITADTGGHSVLASSVYFIMT